MFIKKIKNIFLDVYIYLEEINEQIAQNLNKIKNINIIYNNSDFESKNFEKVKKFCNKNNINLFIIDNFKLAVKLRLNGIIISHNNKRNMYFGNPLCKIISLQVFGKVHSQLDYFFKKRQNCSKVFISPVFKNYKYSINKILKIIKFNLLSLNWKIEIIALGGITHANFKTLRIAKLNGMALKSLIKKIVIKKPIYLLR
jgi:thiamine monophosphate synthase